MSHFDDHLSAEPTARQSTGRLVAMTLAALVVVVAAGLGGVWAAKKTSTSESVGEQRDGAVPANSSSAVPPSDRTTQSARPAAPAAVPKCRAGDVRGSLGLYETNNAYVSSLSLVVTNVSSKTCTIRGYGGAEMYSGGDGRPIHIKLIRDPVPPPATVTLKPGGTATKVLTWKSAAVKYDSACSAFIGFVSIILPDDTQSIQINGDLGQVCDGGKVNGHAYG